MKKNFLTLMFVVAFLFGSALVVSAKSAKTSSSPANSVAVSKKVLLAKTKANSLKVECKSEQMCASELALLLAYNALYEYNCAPDYIVGCSPTLEYLLIGAGMAYEHCISYPHMSKNTDRTMDRNKTVGRWIGTRRKSPVM